MKHVIYVTAAILLAIVASFLTFLYSQNAHSRDLELAKAESEILINRIIKLKEEAQDREIGKSAEEERSKPLVANIDTKTWKTYRNEEFGFELQYPSEWGDMEAEQGVTCYDQETLKKLDLDYTKDSCTQAFFSVQRRMIASITTENARTHGAGRGAFWGDRLWYEEGVFGATLSTVCQNLKYPGDKYLQSCNYFKTPSGLQYIVTMEYNWGPTYVLVYHFATNMKIAPVLSISLDGTGMDMTDQSSILELMTKSIKFFKPVPSKSVGE